MSDKLDSIRPVDSRNLPWRVGRKLGRTVFAVVGDSPSDNDPLIGLFDSRKLAATAVDAHNRVLDTGLLGMLVIDPTDLAVVDTLGRFLCGARTFQSGYARDVARELLAVLRGVSL